MSALKWGIAGAGLIGNDFISAIRVHAPDELKNVAVVAARDLQRAQEFANTHGIAKAYGSYQELADDPDISIVYINTISSAHHGLCLLMLKAGKHVLCEKPLTMSVTQTKEVIECAKQQKRFLMEAMWSRFVPAYEQLRNELKSKTIGDVRLVDAKFSLKVDHIPRVSDPNLGASVIFDMGIYCIQLAMMIFGKERPKVECTCHKFSTGVDDMSNITLLYSKNRMARLFCSGSLATENSAQIYGTEGKLEFPSDMWVATELVTPSGLHQFPIPETELKFNFHNSSSLYYEFKAASKAVSEGLLEHPLMTLDDSLMLVELIEECCDKVGVKIQQ